MVAEKPPDPLQTGAVAQDIRQKCPLETPASPREPAQRSVHPAIMSAFDKENSVMPTASFRHTAVRCDCTHRACERRLTQRGTQVAPRAGEDDSTPSKQQQLEACGAIAVLPARVLLGEMNAEQLIPPPLPPKRSKRKEEAAEPALESTPGKPERAMSQAEIDEQDRCAAALFNGAHFIKFGEGCAALPALRFNGPRRAPRAVACDTRFGPPYRATRRPPRCPALQVRCVLPGGHPVLERLLRRQDHDLRAAGDGDAHPHRQADAHPAARRGLGRARRSLLLHRLSGPHARPAGRVGGGPQHLGQGAAHRVHQRADAGQGDGAAHLHHGH